MAEGATGIEVEQQRPGGLVQSDQEEEGKEEIMP